jgi:hypothetical protein
LAGLVMRLFPRTATLRGLQLLEKRSLHCGTQKKSKKSVLDNLNLNYIYAHQLGPASLSLDGHGASASAPTLP